MGLASRPAWAGASQALEPAQASIFVALMIIACGALALAVKRRHRAAAAEDKARYFARHEPMTGLLNRPHFIEALERLVADLKPHEQAALLTIDLDGLREINDLMGQEAGDDAILRAAARISEAAGADSLVARLSGDKFAVARRAFAIGEVKDLSGRLLAAIGEPLAANGTPVSLSAQIGIAVAPSDGDSALRLLKAAGLALDRARLRGGACFVFFESALETELQRRRELEQQIRDTLAARRFDLHFQPLLDAGQERLNGFEALLRMPDGQGGYVSPAIFIPVAEEIGLIVEIGEWVIQRACALATHWPDHLSVAVNLSPAQFKAGGVCGTVAEALASSGLAPHRLQLEITEGLILHDDEAIMRELAELKALGVSIVMDDFGTGYSSLSYLWKFPFDKIKIDRSFMRGLTAEDGSVVDVLQAIMSLSRALRMRVTAEGVETSLQAAFLKSIGCDEVQGFYFGRPMPIDQVALAILRDVDREEAAAASNDDGQAGRLAAG